MNSLIEVLQYMQTQACIPDNMLWKVFENSPVTPELYIMWKSRTYVPNKVKLQAITDIFVKEAMKYNRDITEYAKLAEHMRLSKQI